MVELVQDDLPVGFDRTEHAGKNSLTWPMMNRLLTPHDQVINGRGGGGGIGESRIVADAAVLAWRQRRDPGGMMNREMIRCAS